MDLENSYGIKIEENEGILESVFLEEGSGLNASGNESPNNWLFNSQVVVNNGYNSGILNNESDYESTSSQYIVNENLDIGVTENQVVYGGSNQDINYSDMINYNKELINNNALIYNQNVNNNREVNEFLYVNNSNVNNISNNNNQLNQFLYYSNNNLNNYHIVNNNNINSYSYHQIENNNNNNLYINNNQIFQNNTFSNSSNISSCNSLQINNQHIDYSNLSYQEILESVGHSNKRLKATHENSNNSFIYSSDCSNNSGYFEMNSDEEELFDVNIDSDNSEELDINEEIEIENEYQVISSFNNDILNERLNRIKALKENYPTIHKRVYKFLKECFQLSINSNNNSNNKQYQTNNNSNNSSNSINLNDSDKNILILPLINNILKFNNIEIDFTFESYIRSQKLDRINTPSFKNPVQYLNTNYTKEISNLDKEIRSRIDCIKQLNDRLVSIRPSLNSELESRYNEIYSIFNIIKSYQKCNTANVVLQLLKKNAKEYKSRRILLEDQENRMNEWYNNNLMNPYPDEDEKVILGASCQLSKSQVDNWFGNKRMRQIRIKKEEQKLQQQQQQLLEQKQLQLQQRINNNK